MHPRQHTLHARLPSYNTSTQHLHLVLITSRTNEPIRTRVPFREPSPLASRLPSASPAFSSLPLPLPLLPPSPPCLLLLELLLRHQILRSMPPTTTVERRTNTRSLESGSWCKQISQPCCTHRCGQRGKTKAHTWPAGVATGLYRHKATKLSSSRTGATSTCLGIKTLQVSTTLGLRRHKRLS